MRFLEFIGLTEVRRPAKTTTPISPAQMHKALLELNRSTAPYTIYPTDEKNVDLIAEWKIVDAAWYQVFAKAGISKTYQIKMRLNEAEAEVRVREKQFSVEWQAGIPSIAWSKQVGIGPARQRSWARGYAFNEKGEYGQVYSWKFATNEIKNPLQNVITRGGWTWRSVVFGF